MQKSSALSDSAKKKIKKKKFKQTVKIVVRLRKLELILEFVSCLSPVIYLALLIKHGYGCQVVSWVESGFGVVLLGYAALQVGPRVHDVVSVTVIVEVLALKDQSQSPTGGSKELTVTD